jgi:hypothetical protein
VNISEIGPVRAPRPTPEEDQWKRSTFWLLLLFPLFYAGVSQLLGQDVDWDLANYHFFDSYWLLVNHMRDVAPAQLQTYLSPVLDIPFYVATQHFPPRLTGSLLAVIQGTAFPLLYLINRHFTARRLVALGLAGLGMFTAGALSEVGNIMGDTLLAPVFFAAILLGLHSFDTTRSNTEKRVGPAVLIVSACGLAGLAAGLKFAELPIALGIAVGFPLVSGNFTQRVHKAIWASGALILGLLLSYGWWGYELATRYGNPILPHMNEIFDSPYAPFAPNNGTTVGIVGVLFDPILWTLYPTRVGGLWFFEASLPIAEVLLITLLAIAVSRAVLHRRPIKVFNSDKQRYLIAVAVVAYFIWVLQYTTYRYLIPIEMLSFTLIFICLQAISTQIRWKPVVSVGTIALALLCVISEQPINWGRSAWSATYFSASIPKSLMHRSGAFLMLGSNADAFVVPYFPQQDYFAQIAGNLPPTRYVKRIIIKDVAAYRDTFTIWEDPVSETRTLFAYAAQAQVEVYGFQIDWNSCNRFPASVGGDPEEFHTCRLKKVSPSKLAPMTLVSRPANGDHLVGHQYLAANAFAVVGLRKVEFSITGEGRTVNARATLSFYGWLGVWNTKAVPNGVYTVHSIAYGINGLVTVSAGVAVEVRN